MHKNLQDHVRSFSEGTIEESKVLLVNGIKVGAGTELNTFIGEKYRREEDHV